MKNKKSHSGETLIEVLMAVSVLMIVIVPASELKVKSIQNLAFNRDNLIAGTLADEGIEVISGIVITNILKFPDEIKTCWDTQPDKNCGNKIEDGSDILKLNTETLKWSLENIGVNALTDDADFGADSKYLLKLDPSTSLYNHDTGSDTGFYREIYIEHEGGDKMIISSRVFFKNGNKKKIAKRVYYLTNIVE